MANDPFATANWDEFIGQEKLKNRLDIHINASIDRCEPLDHVLLLAQPGAGKSSLARIIAARADQNFEAYMAPMKPALLRRVVSDGTGIILIDEIHRMPPRQQETLLPLIQDGYLQFDNGVQVEAGFLTIIGASTEPDKLIAPLIDRFPIRPHFEDYSDEELGLILSRMAAKVGIEFEPDAALYLGRAAGGVPRNARSIVVMARDLGSNDPDQILREIGMTPDGLTPLHIEYLQTLNDCGHVAGLEILGAHTRLPKATIVDLERLLVRRGMIEYSKMGRQLMPNGMKALKGVLNG